MTKILSVRNLTKCHQSGTRVLTVLNDVSLEVESGTSCAIVGPSGSGKTTLLGLSAGLDLPTHGSVLLKNVHLEELGEDERARFRNQTIGFVFQNFQLIPTLTALENIMVPLELRGEKNVRAQALMLAHEVGLTDRVDHYPVQMSGGEQQRVALARAFINRPAILFADEPTGNLDSETSERVEDLLFALNRTHGTTLLIATHDRDFAAKTNRIVTLQGGRLVSDESNVVTESAQELQVPAP